MEDESFVMFSSYSIVTLTLGVFKIPLFGGFGGTGGEFRGCTGKYKEIHKYWSSKLLGA